MSMAASAGELFAAARRVHVHAYVPYCRFPVAAAIRGASGRVYCGVNIDNPSPAHTSCAEANALGALIAAGERQVTEVLVLGGVAGDGILCTPCGGCRQRLAEFVTATAIVHVAGPEGVRARFRFAELLP